MPKGGGFLNILATYFFFYSATLDKDNGVTSLAFIYLLVGL